MSSTMKTKTPISRSDKKNLKENIRNMNKFTEAVLYVIMVIVVYVATEFGLPTMLSPESPFGAPTE